MIAVMHRTPIGQRIELRLREMDRDQKWLAGVLRRSPSIVSRWLDGSRRMATEDLERVALALHRPPSWFLDGASEDESEEAVPA